MNQEIIKSYDYYIKMLKVLERMGGSYKVEEGVSEMEIAELEHKIGTQLPDDYKDWLRLTRCLTATYGSVNLYMNMPEESFDHEDGFKGINVCSSDFTVYYLDLDNGKAFVYDDDFGTEEFDSFADLVDEIYYSELESKMGDDSWVSVYDQMFPEER